MFTRKKNHIVPSDEKVVIPPMTLGQAFIDRMAGYIADNPFRHVIGQLIKLFLFLTVIVACFFHWNIPDILRHFIGFQEGLLVKVSLAWCLIYNYSELKEATVSAYYNVKGKLKGSVEAQKTADFGGLSREELLDFLFEHRDLNIVRYMAEHPATRKNDLTRVIKALQRSTILVKGANNANVLNEDLQWEAVDRMINSAETPDDLIDPTAHVHIRSGGHGQCAVAGCDLATS